MQALRSRPRLSSPLRHVPYLCERAGIAGRAPRGEKGELVMAVIDPISDMLTRIRNAMAVGHETTSMPSSKIKEEIARILTDEGYIDRYEVEPANPGKTLKLILRYRDRQTPAIVGIKRISRPGHRIYRGSAEIPRVQGGLGVAVVSTSQGLLADREARRRRLGGEIVCEVW